MPPHLRFICLFIFAISILLPSPVPVKSIRLEGQSIVDAAYTSSGSPQPEPLDADLDEDGQVEIIRLGNSKLSIVTSWQITWQSPSSWQVQQALTGDLNRDGHLELVLLVQRPFAAWPIDRFLPYPGRIQDFQDQFGLSSHIILIGWSGEQYREVWAGSALAEPVRQMAIADLDSDGNQELITLDVRYEDKQDQPARGLSIWEWNGFGFSLLARRTGNFYKVVPLITDSGNTLLAQPAAPWRQ